MFLRPVKLDKYIDIMIPLANANTVLKIKHSYIFSSPPPAGERKRNVVYIFRGNGINVNFSSNRSIVMLENSFETLYLLFRSNYYKRLVQEIGPREGSLSATESYCVELIYLLGSPTISEFAQYLSLSAPNANYKINSLVKKGYVVKELSQTDRREQNLRVTDKFLAYYGLNDAVTSRMIKRIRETFSECDVNAFDDMLQRVITLMRESEQK